MLETVFMWLIVTHPTGVTVLHRARDFDYPFFNWEMCLETGQGEADAARRVLLEQTGVEYHIEFACDVAQFEGIARPRSEE